MLFSKLRENSIISLFLLLPSLNFCQAAKRFSTETICSKILLSRPPPDGNFVAPIIFHIQLLYKEIYQVGSRLPKRDKLGLHANIEEICLRILDLSIRASLDLSSTKHNIVRELRIYIESLKYLIRTEFELKIIKENQYLSLQEKLQGISKEAAGWERYSDKHKSSPQRELL